MSCKTSLQIFNEKHLINGFYNLQVIYTKNAQSNALFIKCTVQPKATLCVQSVQSLLCVVCLLKCQSAVDTT